MKRYTLAQLDAFSAIVRFGSFHLAAKELGVTQPTVSLRIRDLEAAIGLALFKRGPGQLRLTQSGSTMLHYVERSLTTLKEMDRQLQSGEAARGTLRLGASNTFALAFLPAVLAEIERRFSNLIIDVTISDSNTLAAAMNADTLDIAVLLGGDLRRSVRVEPLATYEIAWLSAACLGIPAYLTPTILHGRRVATLPPTSPLSRTILDWFDAAGASPPVQNRCNDMATLIRLVTAGVALSILPLCAVEPELRSGRVVAHTSEPKLEPFQICTAYSARMPNPAVDALLEVIRDTIKNSLVPHFMLSQRADDKT